MEYNRRKFLSATALCVIVGAVPRLAMADGKVNLEKQYMSISEKEWKERLTPQQFNILRKEATERAGSSPLNHEKREGVFHCVGCDNPLFKSETKFDSGTGWPSFYKALPDAVATKKDFKALWLRTEYHCARCGGHHGHVFEDGPQPTGLRYCNNGAVLKFVPITT